MTTTTRTATMMWRVVMGPCLRIREKYSPLCLHRARFRSRARSRSRSRSRSRRDARCSFLDPATDRHQGSCQDRGGSDSVQRQGQRSVFSGRDRDGDQRAGIQATKWSPPGRSTNGTAVVVYASRQHTVRPRRPHHQGQSPEEASAVRCPGR